MSKTINFLGNSGSVIAKRRKTVKGANHHKRDEVKQYNPFITMKPSEMETANRDNYGAVVISNLMSASSVPSGHSEYWSSWIPYKFADPDQGTKRYERIGDQYFLKYLRFKGYVTCHGNVHMAINWRLVLVRCTEDIFPAASGLARADNYGSLFRNWENFNVTDPSLDTYRLSARHNYHKKIVNTDKTEVYSRKVLASGCIPFNQKRDQIGMLQAGSSSSYSRGNIISIPYGEDVRLIPLDIKVKCNDWIKVNEVRYYIILEVDNPLGSHVAGYSSSAAGDVVLTHTWADREIDLNLFCRAYFIDP